MATITTRVQGASPKGSPLTNAEVDNNFINLNTAKYESGSNVSFGTGLFTGAVTASSSVTIKNSDYESGALNISRNLDTATFGAVAVKQRFGSIYNGSTVYPVEVLGGVDNDGSALYYRVDIDSTNRLTLWPSSATFNEDGGDVDFRVESDGNSNMLFVDAANDRVGIATNNPTAKFHVNGAMAAYMDAAPFWNYWAIDYSSTSTGVYTSSVRGGNFQGIGTAYYHNSFKYRAQQADAVLLNMFNGEFAFSTDSVTVDTDFVPTRRVIFNGGTNTFNENSSDTDFRVESDSNSHALFVDASANTVAVGGTGGWGTLQVIGATNSEYRTFFVTESTDASKGVGIAYDPTNDRGVIAAVDGGTTWKNLALSPSGGYVSIGLPATSSIIAPLHIEGGPSMSGGWVRTLHLEALFPVMTFQSTYNTDTYAGIGYDTSNDNMDFWVGATTSNVSSDGKRVMRLKNSEAAFNDYSIDLDFRVESDGNSNMLFVNGADNRVHIGGTGNTPSGSPQLVTHGYTALNYTGGPIDPNPADILSSARVSIGGDGGNYLSIGTYTNATATGTVWLQSSYYIPNTAAYDLTLQPLGGNVGIGNVPNPATQLHIKNSGVQTLHVDRSDATVGSELGYVTIGAGSSYTAGMKAEIRAGQPGIDRVDLVLGTTTYTSSLQTMRERLRLKDAVEAVVNDLSDDYDFRVESDNSTHMLFVNAGTDNVGINTSSPGALLDVSGGDFRVINSGGGQVAKSRVSTGNQTDAITSARTTDVNGTRTGFMANAYPDASYTATVSRGDTDFSAIGWQFYTLNSTYENQTHAILKAENVAGTEYELINANFGEVIINQAGRSDIDFRVESDSNSNAFKVDASENSGQGAVLVGTGSMFGTGNTDYLAHTMTQAASTTPMLVNGAMFAMPDIPSGKQAQAGRWKFGGFKNHWYGSAGSRVDSSLSQLVVEISGGVTGKTNLELFEIGFNNGWDSRFVMIEVYEMGYVNGGYKKYMFHSGYNPSFTLYENYGNNSISLNVLAEGPFQNGTSTVSSSAVDGSYYRKTVRANLGAYFGGHIVVTIPSYMKITNNAEVDRSYSMRLLNPQ